MQMELACVSLFPIPVARLSHADPMGGQAKKMVVEWLLVKQHKIILKWY
jgi:hypothetical protein